MVHKEAPSYGQYLSKGMAYGAVVDPPPPDPASVPLLWCYLRTHPLGEDVYLLTENPPHVYLIYKCVRGAAWLSENRRVAVELVCEAIFMCARLSGKGVCSR